MFPSWWGPVPFLFYYGIVLLLILWSAHRLGLISSNDFQKVSRVLGTSLSKVLLPFQQAFREKSRDTLYGPTHPTLLDHVPIMSSLLELLDTLNKASNMITVLDPSPPKIVVMGNQGSGKTSLINSIAQLDIKMTSGPGMATLCPVEIHLRRGKKEEWNCAVSVRTPQRTQLFRRISNKDELPGILRQVQIAVLNPNRLDRLNLPDGPPELPFSNDVIVVEIIGAAVDITFVDLPGLDLAVYVVTSRVSNRAGRG